MARTAGLPLLLYWGASWCPPCNRLAAVLFGRPDFLALSDSFVALAIDGDGAGAQRLAEQFKLRSYPTLVVLRPDGAEVTRLRASRHAVDRAARRDGLIALPMSRRTLCAHTATQLSASWCE